jgi:hypothetical protein
MARRARRALLRSGRTHVHYRLTTGLFALALVTLPTAALAEDLTFQLTNQSSVTITNFYTSPANVEEWEEDVFGDAVFPSGNTVPVTIADGSDQCVYDMKFVAEDGSELIEPGIDLCALEGGEYTLTDAE